MEWYVLIYDFNSEAIKYYNIFNSLKFSKGIEELYTKNLSKSEFESALKDLLRYCFWSKREYELSIGDAFEEDLNKYKRVDVYAQLLPNVSILADYIINNKKEFEPTYLIGKKIIVTENVPYCAGYTGTIVDVDAPYVAVKGDPGFPDRFIIDLEYLTFI